MKRVAFVLTALLAALFAVWGAMFFAMALYDGATCGHTRFCSEAVSSPYISTVRALQRFAMAAALAIIAFWLRPRRTD